MPEKVTLNEQNGIIEVASYGVVTKQEIMDSIDIVMKIHREKGIDKVLVDSRQQTRMPNTMEIIELFSKFPDNLKVAVWVSETQPTVKDEAFLETVAINRFFKFRMFFSEEQALAWLNAPAAATSA